MSIFADLPDTFTETLGQVITITPSGAAARDIYAIFVARPTSDLDITQSGPLFHAKTADVVGLTDGDTVTINTQQFIARTFEPDGQGMTAVYLEADNG